MPKPTKRWHHDRGGEFFVVRETIPDETTAMERRNEIEQSERPDHTHLWSSKLQRSDRGKRCEVEVWFRLELGYQKGSREKTGKPL